MPADPKPDPNPGKSSNALGSLVQAESAIQLALAIPAGVFVGLLLGYLLDKHFHTHWIVLLGMALGAIGGFIQVFQSASKMIKRGDD